jgi:hypothetical protein
MIITHLSAEATRVRFGACTMPVLRLETRPADVDTWQVWLEGEVVAEALDLQAAHSSALRIWNLRTFARLLAARALERAFAGAAL